MGKISKYVEATTESMKKDLSSLGAVKAAGDVISETGGVIQDSVELAGKAVVLSLSKAWIGIGLINPATTEKNPVKLHGGSVFTRASYGKAVDEHGTPTIDRFDTTKMWSIRFDDYFLPLSQTYTLEAQKKLNTSSLVDGIDIIQQTRKEAKTVDCNLRISINENVKALQILDYASHEVKTLSDFLYDLYDKNAVFRVQNSMLNNTFSLEYVIMTKYKFTPKAGSKVYSLDFSLMEVSYGDNVLTFDERQLQSDSE